MISLIITLLVSSFLAIKKFSKRKYFLPSYFTKFTKTGIVFVSNFLWTICQSAQFMFTPVDAHRTVYEVQTQTPIIDNFISAVVVNRGLPYTDASVGLVCKASNLSNSGAVVKIKATLLKYTEHQLQYNWVNYTSQPPQPVLIRETYDSVRYALQELGRSDSNFPRFCWDTFELLGNCEPSYQPAIAVCFLGTITGMISLAALIKLTPLLLDPVTLKTIVFQTYIAYALPGHLTGAISGGISLAPVSIPTGSGSSNSIIPHVDPTGVERNRWIMAAAVTGFAFVAVIASSKGHFHFFENLQIFIPSDLFSIGKNPSFSLYKK